MSSQYSVVQSWSPPQMGELKINLDASFDYNTSDVGVSLIIRDSTGQCRCIRGRNGIGDRYSGVDEFTMLVGGSDAAGSLQNELAELGYTYRDHLFAAIDPIPAIAFPPVATTQWQEQIKSLELLLTVKESALNVPTNLEARRRIAFFTNSLFMEMPRAPPVRKMWSFSVMTPYYSEETVYSKSDLELENEDGVSIIFYLQKIFPDEWNNFIIHTTTHFSDLKMKRSRSMWLWRCSFMIYGEEDKSAT
ncbi:callose synthase 5-like [Papaver somniferum]|uniref:callose synthase 5-like n=1 Tax=Papaver somniferum TaxID=3469 RepID=UPI000E6F6196|nr:callose synthase 5-like [Papaver somniferum]